MAPPTASPILTDAMLQRFRERAPGYDRENRFFQEDFDDLRQAGYLAIAVPRELGGRGLAFAECMREQDYYDRRYQRRVVSNLMRRAQELGYTLTKAETPATPSPTSP